MMKDTAVKILSSLVDDLKVIAHLEKRSVAKQIQFFLEKDIQEYKEKHSEEFYKISNYEKLSFMQIHELLKQNKLEGAKPLNIICIEDYADHAETLYALVEHFGHFGVIAENGETAIALARAQKYDAAIIDYHLPDGMTGKEVMIELQKITPDIQCIILTADTRQIIRDSFNELEKKPFGFASKAQGTELLKKWLGQLSKMKGKKKKPNKPV